jgi:hypothetical protein
LDLGIDGKQSTVEIIYKSLKEILSWATDLKEFFITMI